MKLTLIILSVISFLGSCLTFFFSDKLSTANNGKMKYVIYGFFSLFILSITVLIIFSLL